MSQSYLTESEAPRDFRVSSTESDGHYMKCVLCFTVKRYFYCQDCVKNGNFLHSSMPYSDRYSEKQAKLLRLKLNRKHVLDRCEKLLEAKLKKDSLLTDAKQARDKLELIRLAIEQRRNSIIDRKKTITELTQYNNELRLKLPRYSKRVASLGQHVHAQQTELSARGQCVHEHARQLAALRRERIRQLTKYIFPVYITYDTSESIEDLEFLESEDSGVMRRQCRLHVVVPWVAGEEPSRAWAASKDSEVSCPSSSAWHRRGAALELAAQLLALLARITDLPLQLRHTLDSSNSSSLSRRVSAAAAALAARQQLAPSYLLADSARADSTRADNTRAPLAALHALCVAAACDDPMLGRVEGWLSESTLNSEWVEMAACDVTTDDDEPPEHLSWPDTNEMEELSSSPAAPPASLVTSLASLLRGWTK